MAIAAVEQIDVQEDNDKTHEERNQRKHTLQ
jgi:hypothetical protein